MLTGYDPEIYELVSEDRPSVDLDWYIRLARNGAQPVLELGAGSGRVVLPMARVGIGVDALDLDARMLWRLRRRLASEPEQVRRLVRVLCADMRKFGLRQRYGLIQIPFRGFQHNLTRDDQLACLRESYEHLRPGGTLALTVFHPSLTVMRANSGVFDGVWRWGEEYRHPTGGTIIRSAANRYDTVRQTVSARHRYEHFDERGTLVRVWLQRLEWAYLYPGDIRALLQDVGFTEINIWGDYNGGLLRDDRQDLVIQARRAR